MASDEWTVSSGPDGTHWAVFYEGRMVIDGYERASEATWAVTFLSRGRRPPFVPDGAVVDWPAGWVDRLGA
ncbi:MAG TPA: hypothetical protein VH834_05100 [Solirubrobacteraceae bacterium]|jgi:hypothetical protein